MEFNDQEHRAIAEFLRDHWAAFVRCARQYMDEREIEDLGEKLDEEL